MRSVIRTMEGYVPGEQPQDRRYIKLNTNENPYPPSPHVLEALRSAVADDLRLYPDPTAKELRAKAAEVYGVEPDQIVAGNGSDDLLSMLFRACVDAGAPADVAYPVPTYSLYDTLTQIQGTEPQTAPFGTDFALPAETLLAFGARLNLICNPNSPTGTLTPVAALADFARKAKGVVVVDEAYVDFARESALPLLRSHPNVVVLRTFSKSFSLAGMRIGLAFGSRELIAHLNKVKDSYNLDRLSLVAARAALEDLAWMQANVDKIKETRESLVRDLGELGFRVPPSEANFVFAVHPKLSAADLYRALRERGILVRHFATPALRDGLRITVGTNEQNGAFVSALRSLCS
ncbi:MAG TPA: histidinol-phosphate transaminase [Polyangiaceae bacterium]|nr:histidinol-phosphate transaminase [Polyangiaceae bacterium]